MPAPSYTDGVVTIRRQQPSDLEADLEAKDDEQIDRLWMPGQRELWEAMTPVEQRAHARAGLVANHDRFGRGPKWTFGVDGPTTPNVACVDCDLANAHVPAGEANISYAAHPAHRGARHVSRAVRLVLAFLRDNTGAPRAHLIADVDNVASVRVAVAVGARPVGSWVDDQGRTVVRHVIEIDRPS